MDPVLHGLLPAWPSPLGLAYAFAGCILIIIVCERFFLGVPYPKGIPLIREPEGARRFSLRTRLAYYTDCEALFREAYQNYGKKGLPVVLPGLGVRHDVIMPPSIMSWILAQPESVLSVTEAFADIDLFNWSLGTSKIVLDAWQGLLIRTDLNRVLEASCAAMNDELHVAFDEYFGTDAENWREIDLLETVRMVVAQAASRFAVGVPLCRNKDYLRNALHINHQLVLNAGLTGMAPYLLQPLVGTLVNISTFRSLRKMRKWINPLWKKRLETLQFERDDPNHDEPLDLVQMMIRYAQRERPHELDDYGLINNRIAANNMGIMHQTAYAVCNLLLNVISTDAEFDTIQVLRDETERVLGSDGSDKWTKAKISQMTRADSIARETLRRNAFSGRANFRKVMTDDFTTKDGCHIPKNTTMSFLSQPAGMDPETTQDPFKFDPFRFSRQREAAVEQGAKVPALGLVSTSPDFMPFGHGKHACPGRFLIDFELKMIMAYVLRHYDIKFPDEYKGERPANFWMAEASLPPSGVKIMVKRRRNGKSQQ
ncbi:cytochrome P450 [Thelonectria olida]|uniref:Cytochrome P450 n=1 Tax=Thelonectria olida TaxID=1576542 RepID=A0A9P8W284_9HYPO|nr:cytochrome P450 [Thelonectria olida]